MTAPPSTSHADPSTKKTFIVGTRQSKLALLQTDLVIASLKEACPDCSFQVLSKETAGDLNQKAFREISTKNLWTEELEELLVAGEVDFIVHSLKDVPTLIPASCTLGPMLKREDPRDVLVMKTGLPYKGLADLPPGSVVGTSSVRRSAQLARRYPHLKIQDVRGNIGTRLAKLDAEDSPFSCIILAAAGLLRVGLQDRITQYLDSKTGGMLHAVGQGALGIEIRRDDRLMLDMLDRIGHHETTFAALAERSLLRTLEGGCSAPLGVETEWVRDSDEAPKLRMKSIVVSVDGTESSEVELDGVVNAPETAEAFGVTVANALVQRGGGEILETIHQNKEAP
ncbi:porphobilinogen deaminase [Aspergillus sp. HF37]|nr:porphobilinogen deaminase [Aspergillus sp. HF37]